MHTMHSTSPRRSLVGFWKNHTSNSQKSISDVKNCFFQKPTRLRFGLVECAVCIFKARYVYEKCSLMSRLSSDIIQTITRHIKMISRQLRVLFVDVKKILFFQVIFEVKFPPKVQVFNFSKNFVFSNFRKMGRK